MSEKWKKISLIKYCILTTVVFTLAMLVDITADAAIFKQPVPVHTESVVSSQSYKEEYIKVRTPKKEKYVVYVSGKVKKNVKRLCIRIKKHNEKIYITTFVKPNKKGEFSIKINTKKGNTNVPEVIGDKGTVTKASNSYGTRPGYRAVKKMTSGIYHLYVTAAKTKKDADVSKGSKWTKGTLGGSEGRIFKEALLIVSKKDPNNLKLVKYDEVINNNVQIRSQYESGNEYIGTYKGSQALYTDVYMKDISFVFYNPVTKKKELLEEYQVDYITEIASEITADCKTQYQKGLKIYEYVARNFYYDNYAYNQHKNQYANPYQNLYKLVNKSSSANSVDGKVATTCQGFAALVVSLARAEGIPARFAYGRHIHQPKDVWTDLSSYELSLTTHYWPELYIEDEWIVADARGATRNQWVRESFEDEGTWYKKKFINYAHYHPTDELLSNSYIYNGIYPGATEGKYLNKKNEIEQLSQFLEYETENGKNNGSRLNDAYVANVYSTWGTDEERNFMTDGYGSVSRIDWDTRGLAGELDLSDFSKLKSLYVYNNKLEKINLSGCNSLKYISATYNNLTEFDCSSSSKIEQLYLTGNELKSVRFVHVVDAITIKSTDGGTFSIKYNKEENDSLTIESHNPARGYRYLGIYDEDTGDLISTEKSCSFTPLSTNYVVRYEKIWIIKVLDNLITEIKDKGIKLFDSLALV